MYNLVEIERTCGFVGSRARQDFSGPSQYHNFLSDALTCLCSGKGNKIEDTWGVISLFNFSLIIIWVTSNYWVRATTNIILMCSKHTLCDCISF